MHYICFNVTDVQTAFALASLIFQSNDMSIIGQARVKDMLLKALDEVNTIHGGKFTTEFLQVKFTNSIKVISKS